MNMKALHSSPQNAGTWLDRSCWCMPTTRSSLGLENEDFDRDVGILVDLAHVGDHLAAHRRLHHGGEVLLHRLLEAAPDLVDRVDRGRLRGAFG